MALKGTLKDFSVSDIFQLIGQQGKSGSLFVKTNEKEAHIVFDHGKVVLGTFKRSDQDFLLGTMMLRAQVITADQLAKAMENQKATLRSIGDILKSMGVINSAILGEFVALQLKEILFRIFQWKDGLYEFVAEKIQYNKAIIKPQSAEAVLMDGFRMLDEWPQISHKVGSLEGVFQTLVDPNELGNEGASQNMDDQLDKAFSSFGEEDSPIAPSHPKGEENQVSVEEKRILPFLDGKRSLQEVIYLGRIGTFDTYKAVSSLIARGWAEKVTELVPTQFTQSASMMTNSASLGNWLKTSRLSLSTVFVLFGLSPVIGFGLRSHLASNFPSNDQRQNAEVSTSLQDLRLMVERTQLVEMLELYHLENGTYPYSLDDLNSKLVDRWEYQRNQNQFKLQPKF